MDTYNFCLALAKCQRESEVISILKREWYWNDMSAWQYLWGDNWNASTIGNQQSEGDCALVEKLTNSVDALLMRECIHRGIDPTGEDAPSSMEDAVEKFFDIAKGKLSSISGAKRWQITEIHLVATGDKTNPTYTVVDTGEGQCPERFKETILSTKGSNKSKIPFVQGKFNMWGTGILTHSGKEKMELIISRRHPDIVWKEGENLWGFTITRRLQEEWLKSPVYKYLAPRGEISTFRQDEWLPIFPTKDGDDGIFKGGMYIKFFDYNIGRGKASRMFAGGGIRDRLNVLLPWIGLPIRLYERRFKHESTEEEQEHGFDMSIVSWLSVLLESDEEKREEKRILETGFPTGGFFHTEGEEMEYLIYAFKTGKKGARGIREWVIFTINGQSHGFLPETFFGDGRSNESNVGLQPIRDSLLVLVDCSELSITSRDDLFASSRDRLKDCELQNSIKKELREILKNHPGLSELKQRRREEEVNEKLQDSKPLAEALHTLLKKVLYFRVSYRAEIVSKIPYDLPIKNQKKILSAKIRQPIFDYEKMQKNSNIR